MSKALNGNPHYDGRPEYDDWEEVIISDITAQFIVDKISSMGVCATRLSVGAGTCYNMVFIEMHHARKIPLTTRAIDRIAAAGKPAAVALALMATVQKGSTPWPGGGTLYVGIETRGSYSFELSSPLHVGYVMEKLYEKCDEIGENITKLLNLIRVMKPTSMALEMVK